MQDLQTTSATLDLLYVIYGMAACALAIRSLIGALIKLINQLIKLIGAVRKLSRALRKW